MSFYGYVFEHKYLLLRGVAVSTEAIILGNRDKLPFLNKKEYFYIISHIDLIDALQKKKQKCCVAKRNYLCSLKTHALKQTRCTVRISKLVF